MNDADPTSQRSDAPRWGFLIKVVIGAFVVRLVVAMISDNVGHADEIFQYLEQSHRLVFGYGHVPWEYRFGIRSWIMPLFGALPLYACRSLGLSDPAYYGALVEIVCCALATSLVVSAYVIGRNLATETVGRAAALLIAFWYELIYLAQKCTPETFATYCLVGAVATLVAARRRPLLCGVLCGLAAVLRLQYLPVAGLCWLVAVLIWTRKEVLLATAVAAAIVLLAGYLDYVTWGTWFGSYYNAYYFNQTHGISDMFGRWPVYYFPATLTFASFGIFPLAGIATAVGLFLDSRAQLSGQKRSLKTLLDEVRRSRGLLLVLGCALAVVGAHSAIAHKEYRFVILAIPLLLIMVAYSAHRFLSGTRLRVALGAVLAVSVVGLAGYLPLESRLYDYAPLSRQDSLGVNRALSRMDGVVGVAHLSLAAGQTGGYYLLHKKVPVYYAPDLKLLGEPLPNLTRTVSHVVCLPSDCPREGFKTKLSVGKLEIREQTNPPAQYEGTDTDTQPIRFKGIDGVFPTTVRPWF